MGRDARACRNDSRWDRRFIRHAVWSFAQTQRPLVLATDMWLRRAILEVEQPFHPLGLPNAEYETDGNDMS